MSSNNMFQLQLQLLSSFYSECDNNILIACTYVSDSRWMSDLWNIQRVDIEKPASHHAAKEGDHLFL